MAKKTIEDIQVKGKKVLVRCDFNVPMDENKVITDENRLRGALPTIKYRQGAGRRPQGWRGHAAGERPLP